MAYTRGWWRMRHRRRTHARWNRHSRTRTWTYSRRAASAERQRHEGCESDLGIGACGFSGARPALQFFSDAALRAVAGLRDGDRPNLAQPGRLPRRVYLGVDWRAG